MRSLIFVAFVISWGVTSTAKAEPVGNPKAVGDPQFRHPVAICLSADGGWVYVANRRSGTLSVVNAQAHLKQGGDEAGQDSVISKVFAEVEIGKQPSAMIWLQQESDRVPPDGVVPPASTLAITDEQSHQLLLVDVNHGTAQVRERIAVAPYPVAVAQVAPDQLVVSSLWSQQLTRVRLNSTDSSSNDATTPALETLDMPWAPRCLLQLPNGQLLVADAFGGRLALVDLKTWKLMHVRQFPSHNIRGLALSRDKKKVVIAHQMLNELAHTVRNDVHWGLLMSNDLRYVPVASFLKSKGDLYQFNQMHPLGEAGNATSDPSGLAVSRDGSAIVTLGGVGEVAIGREDEFSLGRLKVGTRPTGVHISKDGKLAATANTFDDSITLIDMSEREVLETVSLGVQPKLTLVDRGERLFFDGSLSHDSWMSCHSCHPDGHTNGQLNDNLSDFNTFGAPKRVLSLLGKRNTEPFAWSGSAKTFAEQISNSIKHTMQSDREPRERDVAALTAYLKTLDPPPSIDVARQTVDAAAVQRGAMLFKHHDCKRCHQGDAFTSADTFDVGLEDELGRREFNPPSLRGVGQRSAFFHDGRAKTLPEVFRKHQHQLDEPIEDDDLADLVAFLRSL